MPIIQEWYYTDSWVYRSFVYAYQNQLWNRTPPKGRSVCVYFWSAILSMILLRPLIGILLFIKWALGKKVRGWLAPLDNQVHRLFVYLGWRRSQEDPMPGFSMAVAAFWFVCSIVLFPSVMGIVSIVQGLLGIGAAVGEPLQSLGGLPQLLIPLGLTTVLIASAIKASIHEDDPDRCQVEWYSRFATVLSIALMAFLRPHELGYILSMTGGALLWFLAFVGKYVFVVPVLWIVHGVVSIYRWFFLGNNGAVWAAALAALFVLSFLASYRLTTFQPEEKKKEPSLGDKLDSLIENLYWSLFGFYTHVYNDDGTCVRITPSKNSWTRFLSSKLIAKLTDYLLGPADADSYSKLVADLRAEWAAETQRRLVAQAKRDAACKRITSVLAKLFLPIAWTFKQSRIFFHLLVEIGKAKKSGVCPYLEFKERQ